MYELKPLQATIRSAIETALSSAIKPHKFASNSKKTSIKTAIKNDVSPDDVLSFYLKFFDLKSKDISDGFASSREKPFEALLGMRGDLNVNIRTMFQKIFFRRLFFIRLNLKKSTFKEEFFSQSGAQDPWFDNEISFTDYELPGPFRISCRQSKVNGVPGIERVEDELVFDILRIIELVIMNESPEEGYDILKRILDAPNVYLAIKEIEENKLVPILLRTCPDSIGFFIPNFNINKLSIEQLSRFYDEKGVDDWKSLLFRLMLGIHLVDDEILSEVTVNRFIELLFEKEFDKKSDKLISSKISRYRKILGIKSKFTPKLP